MSFNPSASNLDEELRRFDYKVEAGAEFILVPEGNYEAALTAPRDSIEIVPVATLQDAIDFFDQLGEA